MTRGRDRYFGSLRRALLAGGLLPALLLGAVDPALAQQDRERAQMLQMQQQLQRLQSDNAALQTAQQQASDKLKEQSEAAKAAQRDVKKLRAESAAQAKEADDLRGQLAELKLTLAAAQGQIEQLHKDVEQRDRGLQEAADKQKSTESAAALVAQRLKLQTARSDQCEVKHTDAILFATRLIDRIEHDRLRLCEPFTGIWKVKAEADIQALRQKLDDLQLDSVRVEVKQ